MEYNLITFIVVWSVLKKSVEIKRKSKIDFWKVKKKNLCLVEKM